MLQKEKNQLCEEVGQLIDKWERNHLAVPSTAHEIGKLRMLALLIMLGSTERSEIYREAKQFDGTMNVGLNTLLLETDAIAYAAILCGLDDADFSAMVKREIAASDRWLHSLEKVTAG